MILTSRARSSYNFCLLAFGYGGMTQAATEIVCAASGRGTFLGSTLSSSMSQSLEKKTSSRQ